MASPRKPSQAVLYEAAVPHQIRWHESQRGGVRAAGGACARGGLTLSEWVRDAVLAAGRGEVADAGVVAVPRSEEGVVLAEVLALRAVVINLLFSISQGERKTPQEMQALIEQADAGMPSSSHCRFVPNSSKECLCLGNRKDTQRRL